MHHLLESTKGCETGQVATQVPVPEDVSQYGLSLGHASHLELDVLQNGVFPSQATHQSSESVSGMSGGHVAAQSPEIESHFGIVVGQVIQER